MAEAEWTKEESRQVLEDVCRRAQWDGEFRQLALTDPGKAFEQIAEKAIPEGVSIKFIESEPGVERTFVLPDYFGDDLTDEQLEAVAGGNRGWICTCDNHTCYLDIL